MKKINLKKINKIPIKKIRIQTNLRITGIFILSILVIISAYSTYAALQEPTTTEENIPIITYNHQGHFSYVAYLTENTVYNTSKLYPEQGNIFKKITAYINGSLNYRFYVMQNADIYGNYTLTAKIHTDLWEKEYTLIPKTSFSSNNKQQAGFDTIFPINFTRFESIVGQIDNETGITSLSPTLIMKFNIDINAGTDKGIISELFTPWLNVSLGDNVIDIEGNLSQYQTGYLSETVETTKSGVIEKQTNWSAYFVILLIILFLFVFFTTTEIPTKDVTNRQIRKIKKKYGEWIVETEELPTTKDAKTIPMKTLDDLVKISEELGKPIIYTTKNEKHTFSVLEEKIHYQYVLTDNGRLKKTTNCPKCRTKITCEGKTGEKVHVTCPNCGNKGIISFEETNPVKKLLSKLR